MNKYGHVGIVTGIEYKWNCKCKEATRKTITKPPVLHNGLVLHEVEKHVCSKCGSEVEEFLNIVG